MDGVCPPLASRRGLWLLPVNTNPHVIYMRLKRRIADVFIRLHVAFLGDVGVFQVQREAAQAVGVQYAASSQVYVRPGRGFSRCPRPVKDDFRQIRVAGEHLAQRFQDFR